MPSASMLLIVSSARLDSFGRYSPTTIATAQLTSSRSKKFLLINLIITFITLHYKSADAFWLTDGSLFQSAAPTKTSNYDAISSSASSSSSSLSSSAQQAAGIPSQQQPGSSSSSSFSSSISTTTTTTTTPTESTRSLSSGSPKAHDKIASVQQQCRCTNADWIQDQALAHLQHWLMSPTGVRQMRSALSLESQSKSKSTQLQSAMLQPINNSPASHSSDTLARSGSSIGQQQHLLPAPSSIQTTAQAKHLSNAIKRTSNDQNGSTKRWNTHWTRAARHQPSNVSNTVFASSQVQQQSKLAPVKSNGIAFSRDQPTKTKEDSAVQVRATSGRTVLRMISVPDWSALFELDWQPSGQLDGSAKNAHEKRLVFVDSEQTLVLGTKFGWRPIQLGSPVQDPRKIVAKFNLWSPNERRRLMSSEYMDNSISNPKTLLASFTNVQRPFGVPSMLSRSLGQFRGLPEDDTQDNDDNLISSDTDDDNDDDDIEDDEDDTDGVDDVSDDDDDDDDDDNGTKRNNVNLPVVDDVNDDDDYEDDASELDNRIGSGSRSKGEISVVDAPQSSEDDGTSNAKLSPSRHKHRLHSQSISGRSALTASSLSLRGETNSLSNNIEDDKQASGVHGAKQVGGADESAAPEQRQMKLRIIALNEPFAGNIHGVRGANFECQRNAARSNVKGSFKAMLASNYQYLNEIVRNGAQKYPLINLRGQTIANSWHDLFKQPALFSNPLSRVYSFDGRLISADSRWPNKLVWHGSGNQFGQRDSPLAHNCDGWHSDAMSKFGFASPLHSPKSSRKRAQQQQQQQQQSHRKKKRFIGSPTLESQSNHTTVQSHAPVFGVIEKYPCRMPLIVLCIETIAQ